MNEYEVWLTIGGQIKVVEITSHTGAGAIKFALEQYPGAVLRECIFCKEVATA
jgi:hypothetical protein